MGIQHTAISFPRPFITYGVRTTARAQAEHRGHLGSRRAVRSSHAEDYSAVGERDTSFKNMHIHKNKASPYITICKIYSQ